MSPVDGAVLAVMGIALVRGLWIGMVRETFSVAALAAACIAVRFETAPLADWLRAGAGLPLGPTAARVVAGAAIGIGTALVVGLTGRVLARMLRGAGLGLADRLAGGVIGVAEGALLAGVLLFAATLTIGRESRLLSESRALHTFERFESLARERASLPPVAAPPQQAEGASR
jgi:uncharacterized membrane protein required for colicin V production